jgi:hypothetical protein
MAGCVDCAFTSSGVRTHPEFFAQSFADKPEIGSDATLKGILTRRTNSLIALDKFIEQTGLSSVTIWRFRKKQFLKTINICGRHYVLRSEIVRFNSRGLPGEFAKPCNRPPTKSTGFKRPVGNDSVTGRLGIEWREC